MELGRNAARMMLYATQQFDDFNVMKTRRIQGFDIVRDDPKQGLKTMGDRFLFEGLDSALRASLWWSRRDLPVVFSLDESIIRVIVPILVLSRPWHDFSIDEGRIGDPIETHVGFISNLYPVHGGSSPPTPLFGLVVARDRLQQLQGALLEVFVTLSGRGMSLANDPI
jgi:hypothetical protein